MRFLTDSRTLLKSLPTLTGDPARLALRLTRALDIIERDRAAMREAYADIMKRYDAQAARRLENRLSAQEIA